MTHADDAAEAISNALAEWLASNGGGFVTGFAACFEYVDADGDRAWAVAHHDTQTPAHTLGLLRWHTMNVEQQCIGYMCPDEDD